MYKYDKLKREINELEHKINNGIYKGEQLLIANDMLNDKKSELDKLTEKKVTSVINAPVKGLKEPKSNVTAVKMSGGMRF